MSVIHYDKETDMIIIEEPIKITPEKLVTVLNECLLMQLYKLKLFKIAKMKEYIQKHLALAEQAQQAESGFELRKASAVKNILREVRHAIKLTEMEETRIRNELLEREMRK